MQCVPAETAEGAQHVRDSVPEIGKQVDSSVHPNMHGCRTEVRAFFIHSSCVWPVQQAQAVADLRMPFAIPMVAFAGK